MKKIYACQLITMILTFSTITPVFSQTVTFMKKPVMVNNGQVQLHAITQPFKLVKTDLKPLSVGGPSGKVQVIATIVSLNTPVCDKETMKLNTLAKRYPYTQFFIVSKDLPFELAKFTSEYKLKNVNLVSSFRNADFSRYYGVLIDNTESFA